MKKKSLFSEQDSLESKVYQAIGAGSMCWTSTPPGVFDSDRAGSVANEIWKEIQAVRTKDSDLIQRMVNDLQDFVDKVDRGEAKSRRSYAAFKKCIELAKASGFTHSE